MRWPAVWTDASALDRLAGSGIDVLLVGNSDEFESVRARAAQSGLRVEHPDTPPDGVRVVKGEWPGVRISRGNADASAGPTGVPWVDSNGWAARVSKVLHPESAVWIDAPPVKQPFASSYLTAVADTAAYGGRWIVSLDDALADGIARGNDRALSTWKTISQATAFFSAHPEWQDYEAAATSAVVSSFSGDDEFFSHELLNLLARAGQHYRIVRKESIAAPALRGLRAAIYADAQPPSAGVRKELTAFAEAGGLLITTPAWGDAPPSAKPEHPRYAVWTAGKGRIARATARPEDPYEMAQDATILISHRYDLVRFWNAGAAGSYYSVAPDGKRAVAHLLFYSNRGPDSASIRVAGPYRKVKASMVDTPELSGVTLEAQKDGIEVHLPQVSQYVALELSL